MSIAFPLANPFEDPTMRRPTSLRLRPRKVTAANAAPFSFVQQVYEHPGERWEGEFTLPPMVRERGMRWAAWLTSLRGRAGSFLMGDPLSSVPMGTALVLPGTPQVDGVHAALERVLRLKTGHTRALARWLLAGSYLSLGAGSTRRLHMVTRDASLDASGKATLEIWPALRGALAGNDAVALSNTTGKFMLVSQVDYGADVNGHYRSATVAFEEDLRP